MIFFTGNFAYLLFILFLALKSNLLNWFTHATAAGSFVEKLWEEEMHWVGSSLLGLGPRKTSYNPPGPKADRRRGMSSYETGPIPTQPCLTDIPKRIGSRLRPFGHAQVRSYMRSSSANWDRFGFSDSLILTWGRFLNIMLCE